MKKVMVSFEMKRLFALMVFAVMLLGVAGVASASVLNVPTNYSTIQAAIDASSWGDTVLVAPGEYVESITLKPGVTVQSAEGPEVTTIRGDGSWWRWWWYYMWTQQTYTVFGASNSTVSGFTITGSFAGILNYSSSPTITNNVITGNEYGIYNWWGTSPRITNNIIGPNVSSGIACYSSWPTITNNIILQNGYHGIFSSFSSLTVTNNTIIHNGHSGIFNFYSYLTTTNNIITHNSYGILNNNSSPTITYNNLWGNWQNIYNSYSYPTVADNISADPMLVDPVAGDYHLQAGSPCIDAGTNEAPGLPETDFDGIPRIVDGNDDGVAIVDMGAFEFHIGCILSPKFEITSFGPEYIWPPNRKMKEVTVSGKVLLPAGCTLLGAGYSMDDEYGVYSSEGKLAVDADGNFTLTLQVEPWRNGGDIDGRHYSINLFAEDEIGEGSKALRVLVPHDQRK